MDIYVGNLSYQTTEDELKSTFEQFGQVASVRIVKDKFSGDSKGYGFVEMAQRKKPRRRYPGLTAKTEWPYSKGQRGAPARTGRPGRQQGKKRRWRRRSQKLVIV
jgi:hypothetical protein